MRRSVARPAPSASGPMRSVVSVPDGWGQSSVPFWATTTPPLVIVLTPPALWAPTTQLIVWPSSRMATVNVSVVAPVIGDRPRTHSYVNVGLPVQLPGLQDSRWPGSGVPLTAGLVTGVGAAGVGLEPTGAGAATTAVPTTG